MHKTVRRLKLLPRTFRPIVEITSSRVKLFRLKLTSLLSNLWEFSIPIHSLLSCRFMIIEIDEIFNLTYIYIYTSWRFFTENPPSYVSLRLLWQATKLFHNFRMLPPSRCTRIIAFSSPLSEIFYFLLTSLSLTLICSGWLCEKLACVYSSAVWSVKRREITIQSIQYSEALMRSNLGGTFYCFIILYTSLFRHWNWWAKRRKGWEFEIGFWKDRKRKRRETVSLGNVEMLKFAGVFKLFLFTLSRSSHSSLAKEKKKVHTGEKCETTGEKSKTVTHRWDVVRWWREKQKKKRKINLHLNKTDSKLLFSKWI